MELRFWRDAETGLPHIYDHGVTEDEVRQVMDRPGEEFAGKKGSRIRIGKTEVGRILKVVYAPDFDGGSAFVITAYDMTAKGKRAFRRRQRRKKR